MFNFATLAGGLFSLAWFIFFDGIVVQARMHRLPETALVDWIPAVLSTMGFGAIIAVPTDALVAELNYRSPWGATNNRCSTCALFVSFIVSMTSIMVAISILQSKYIDHVSEVIRRSPSYSTWPGVAAVVQATLLFIAALLLLYHRMFAKERARQKFFDLGRLTGIHNKLATTIVN